MKFPLTLVTYHHFFGLPKCDPLTTLMASLRVGLLSDRSLGAGYFNLKKSCYD
jgi:hypothetical protein